MSMANREDLAHLLRRATFGPTAEEVDAAERVGPAATIDGLLHPAGTDAGATRTPPPRLPVGPQDQQERRDQARALTEWWLDRMVAAEHQLAEKLVFFWHGHWATSIQKVRLASLMLRQQGTFRRYGRDMAALTRAMVRDPALIIWLDGHRNTRTAPNENLARELMELFTLGIGNYSEADIKAGARALTGWTTDRATGTAVLAPRRHDPGSKTILGQTARHDADSLVDLLLGQPAAPRFLAARLWFRFGSASVAPPSVPAGGLDVPAVLRTLFTDAAFAGTRGHLVKQPVEWAVGAMRQLGIKPSGLAEADRKTLRDHLQGMQQTLFRPPSVGGWPSGVTWLTSHTSQVRLRASEFLATKAPNATISKLNAAPQQGRPDALARLLVVDAWTPRTRAVLDGVAKDVRKLLALGLISPEYSVQ